MSTTKSRFTVAKLDAGMAILLTSDHHLIEFPSLLLPAGVIAGSIIDLSVAQNATKEKEEREAFVSLQNDIRNLFAVHVPSTPELSIRNVTQTSVVIEWNLLDLATADMRSLSLFKNGSKLGKIPNATTTTTKLSGLALDTEYSFHMVLKTTAGTYTSNILKVKTHKMTNLTGLNVCLSNIRPEERTRVTEILSRIGAKPPHEKVRIDTTHFVTNRGMGDEYKKAQNMNIPVVVPDFVEACEAEGRLMRVGSYYLDSDPALRPKRAAAPAPAAQPAVEAPRPVENVGAVTAEAVLPTSTTPIAEEDEAAEVTPASTEAVPDEPSTILENIVDTAKEIKDKGVESLQQLASYVQPPSADAEGDAQLSIAEAAPASSSINDTEEQVSGQQVVEPHPEAAKSVEDLPAQIAASERESPPEKFPASMGRSTSADMEDVAL